ncbi:hypothetical protein LTR96_011464, partial [Exophiala xenobiotica]
MADFIGPALTYRGQNFFDSVAEQKQAETVGANLQTESPLWEDWIIMMSPRQHVTFYILGEFLVARRNLRKRDHILTTLVVVTHSPAKTANTTKLNS